MNGLIIEVLSEKCYVKVDSKVYICSMRGKFRSSKINPLVGDIVLFDENKRVIEKIFPRKNTIRRPPVSNISQAIIVTSFKNPDFSTNLIDKILIELEFNKIKPIICLTKSDLLNQNELDGYKEIIDYYSKYYKIYYNNELDSIKSILSNETTLFMGQTGSGKSTVLNRLDPNLNLETGEISIALGRGKHTTRHTKIIEMYDGYVLDSPGFSALDFDNMTKTEVRDAFIDFKDYPCVYKDCMHINENECKVKEAVNNNKILQSRYDNYLKLLKTAYLEKEKYKRR